MAAHLDPPNTSSSAGRPPVSLIRYSRAILVLLFDQELRSDRIAADERFAPKNWRVDSKVTAAARTLARAARFVKPGTAFGSRIIAGCRERRRHHDRPELYPPTPMTRSAGATRESARHPQPERNQPRPRTVSATTCPSIRRSE